MASLDQGGAAAAEVLPDSLVCEGMYVVLDQNNGERQSMCLVKAEGMVKIGKTQVSMAAFVGVPFGAVFDLEGNELVRNTPEPPAASSLERSEAVEEVTRDNRAICDTNTAQSLSDAQINELKEKAQSGKEIVNALVANSATFAAKTEFSQAKYLKRKQSKYCVRVTLRRPSACTVCGVMLLKSPPRIHYLRADTLGQLLAAANVGAHQRVLVLDACGGLVTAAIAERLGGFGSVCAVHMSRALPLDIVRFFNLTEAQQHAVTQAVVPALHAAHAAAHAPPPHPAAPEGAAAEGAAAEGAAAAEAPEPAPSAAAQASPASAAAAEPAAGAGSMEVDGGAREDGPEGGGKGKRGAPSGKVRTLEGAELAAVMAAGGFTSLVVAAPLVRPQEALDHLLPLLAPSAAFAVYSNWMQPLVECLDQLTSDKRGLGMQLTELWMREYQVLPMRTHPHMAMSGTGGYLLYGTKVDPSARKPPPGKDKANFHSYRGGRQGGGRPFKKARR